MSIPAIERGWVFPAHAGMSPCGPSESNATQRFPRMRGDEPVIDTYTGATDEFSPHTRG